jgi:hypothetical protein
MVPTHYVVFACVVVFFVSLMVTATIMKDPDEDLKN